MSRCYSTGRPRVTTPNEDRYLAVTAKKNRRSTASDLSRQLSSATGTTVSRQTVYRRLGQIGLYAQDESFELKGEAEKKAQMFYRSCMNTTRLTELGAQPLLDLLKKVLDESRSFFRVHTGYFSNIQKCIKAEFIASWACSQSVLYRAPSVRINLIVCLIELCTSFELRDKFGGSAGYNYVKRG
ncbi:uncharacterized protein TNCV_3947851 [Trichonephila clavipes]|nr:uncharacterized protein TNCV_3947851 [Trichonephila clavipes]